ncbi:MAG: glycosyltransferase family 2 protein [Verrucomicrobia bacterium]|nr:glycosyltransferase family 2 protein [Verrucomicrobiota bacterium]
MSLKKWGCIILAGMALLFLLLFAYFKLKPLPRAYNKNLLKSKAYLNQHKVWTALNMRYPVVEKKRLVLIVTSYNNEAVCEKNLQSIFDQSYENYRLIYIDDCSKDATYEKTKAYIKARGKEGIVTLIRNETRRLKLANLYSAYHSCQDEEIIVSIDGDDWLAHEKVLDRINIAYQNPDVWLTYGSAITYPQYEKTSGIPIRDKVLLGNGIRKEKYFDLSMLRTFYAGLFKQIRLEDFFYQGAFFPTADDVSYMIPMVEMAPKHALFIPDILYVINDLNPIRNYLVIGNLENALRAHIQGKKKYEPLPNTFDPRHATASLKEHPLELIVTSEDTPLFLEASLASYQKELLGPAAITVFFKASSPEYKESYERLFHLFPTVTFLKESEVSLLSYLQKKTDPYVALASDHFFLNAPLSLNDSLNKMGQAFALNFLLGHTSTSCTPVAVDQEISALPVQELLKIKDFSKEAFFLILPRVDLIHTLKQKSLKEDGFLQTHLAHTNPKEGITLFLETKKLFSLDKKESLFPLTKSVLLKKFQEGYSIAVTSLKSHIDQGVKEEDFIKTRCQETPSR